MAPSNAALYWPLGHLASSYPLSLGLRLRLSIRLRLKLKHRLRGRGRGRLELRLRGMIGFASRLPQLGQLHLGGYCVGLILLKLRRFLLKSIPGKRRWSGFVPGLRVRELVSLLSSSVFGYLSSHLPHMIIRRCHVIRRARGIRSG